MKIEFKSSLNKHFPWRTTQNYNSFDEDKDKNYWLSIGLIYNDGDGQLAWLFRKARK